MQVEFESQSLWNEQSYSKHRCLPVLPYELSLEQIWNENRGLFQNQERAPHVAKSSSRYQRKIQQNIYRDIYRKLRKQERFSSISLLFKLYERYLKQQKPKQEENPKKNKHSSCYLKYLLLFTKLINNHQLNMSYSLFLRRIQRSYDIYDPSLPKSQFHYNNLIVIKLKQLASITEFQAQYSDQKMPRLMSRMKGAGSPYEMKQNKNFLRDYLELQQTILNLESRLGSKQTARIMKRTRRPKMLKSPRNLGI